MHKNVRDAACVVVLLGCAVGFLYVGKLFSNFAEKPAIGDLATWVGAFGTFLAFAGTIWIASSEARRRRNDAHALATITMHSLLEKIGAAQGALISVRNKFSLSQIHRLLDFNEIAVKLTGLQGIALEEIKNLLPLGKNIAMDLTRARTQMAMAHSVAEALHKGQLEIRDRDEAIQVVADGVFGALELLEKIAPHIDELEATHNFHFPDSSPKA